jgi:hypothetical protein
MQHGREGLERRHESLFTSRLSCQGPFFFPALCIPRLPPPPMDHSSPRQPRASCRSPGAVVFVLGPQILLPCLLPSPPQRRTAGAGMEPPTAIEAKRRGLYFFLLTGQCPGWSLPGREEQGPSRRTLLVA